jgi:hypothetical protein
VQPGARQVHPLALGWKSSFHPSTGAPGEPDQTCHQSGHQAGHHSHCCQQLVHVLIKPCSVITRAQVFITISSSDVINGYTIDLYHASTVEVRFDTEAIKPCCPQ